MISCIIESRVPFLISLFNFQGPIACPLSRTAQRVYHTLLSLSILFLKVFWDFFQIFFLSAFLDLFRSLSFSLAESLYILSPHKPFVNTFYKLFCAFLTIYSPLNTLCRVFLCAGVFMPLYIVSASAFARFCLYGVWCFHLLFVCFKIKNNNCSIKEQLLQLNYFILFHLFDKSLWSHFQIWMRNWTKLFIP